MNFLLLFSSTRPRHLLRSLLYGLVFVPLFVSCTLKPFSLNGLPCAGTNNECPSGEVCRGGVCRAAGSAECEADSACACGKRCDNTAQVCINITCTNDAECARTGCTYYCDLKSKACVEGTPPSPYCENDTACAGQLCVDFRCQPCTDNSQCSETGRCDTSTGKCSPCQNGSDCTSGLCDTQQGKCVPCSNNDDCTETSFCNQGVCSKCTKNEECSTGKCETTSGKCLPCSANADCATQLCIKGKCEECRKASDCDNGSCNDGVCTGKCNRDEDCASRLCVASLCKKCDNPDECSSGRCAEGRCLGPCASNTDCTNGRVCDLTKKACVLPGEGEPCTPPLNCRDPFLCVDEGNTKICRNECDPLKKNCPQGQLCKALFSAQQTGICSSPQSGKTLGEACDANNPCEVDLICHSDNKCRKLCDAANGTGCASGEACVKFNDNRPQFGLCLSEDCENTPSLCASGTKCIDKQCKTICTSDLDCPLSQICETENGNKLCKDKECGYSGRTCSDGSYCERFRCIPIASLPNRCPATTCTSGTACSGSPATSTSGRRCWRTCVSTCSSGYNCVPTTTKTDQRVCLPKIGGGGNLDECNSTKLCESSHLCVSLTSLEPNNSRCLKVCQTTSKASNQCPAGYECRGLINQPVLGACIKTSPKISVNKRCGIVEGLSCADSLGEPSLCYANMSATDKLPYCRQVCNFRSCTPGYTCVTTTLTFSGGNIKLCLP